MRNGGQDLLNPKARIHLLQLNGQNEEKQMMKMMTLKMLQVHSEVVAWVRSFGH